MQCRRCAHDNPKGLAACEICGQALALDAKQCPVCQTGNPLSAQVCQACGTVLVEMPVATPAPTYLDTISMTTPPPQSTWAGRLFATVLFLLGCGVAAAAAKVALSRCGFVGTCLEHRPRADVVLGAACVLILAAAILWVRSPAARHDLRRPV